MNTRKTVQRLTAALGVGVLALQPLSSVADEAASDGAGDPARTVKHIRGVAVTGVNSVRGKPFFSWGEPFGASFHFPTMGALNPAGPQPVPLDANTPDSAILATWVDPIFLALFNKPPDYVVNPAWINVPLRDVPVNVSFALAEKQPLRGVREAHSLELSQVEPAGHITLGQWLKASGVATIDCAADGATVKLRMGGLIPNRMYTVWATMGMPEQVGPVPAAFPIPLGGAPNTFMTDEAGNASFKRWIKFCPLNTQPGESPLLNIDVQFTATHQTWGAVVAPGFIDGNWPGIITFTHLVFPVNVELLDE